MVTDASKGILSDEEYAKEYPGVTVLHHGGETVYGPGTWPRLSNSERGFFIIHQPKETWLPGLELAYYQGTCSYHHNIGLDVESEN